MTLLELLVKELPKRGGWPEDIWHVAQDSDGQVNGYGDSEPNENLRGVWNAHGFISYLFDDEHMFLCEDYATVIVTREQYEDAIAAQQPVWNGEGLPPVGLLVELMDDSQSQTWGDATIKFYGDSFAVWDDHGEECSNSLCHVKVRPIRTESERKRDLAVGAMERSWESVTGVPAYDFEIIYDDIAAGKTPGLELTK